MKTCILRSRLRRCELTSTVMLPSRTDLNPSPLDQLEKLDAVDVVEVTRRDAAVEPAQNEVQVTKVGRKLRGRSGRIRGPEVVIERSRLVRMERFLRPTARTSDKGLHSKVKHGESNRRLLHRQRKGHIQFQDFYQVSLIVRGHRLCQSRLTRLEPTRKSASQCRWVSTRLFRNLPEVPGRSRQRSQAQVR